MTDTLKFLAFETSTDRLSVAVSRGTQTWHHHGVGGSNASAQLIPVIHGLLQQAELSLNDLTALVIGQGPGSFTGLRTACSVAQGLAMGANLTVIQIDTLMAVAEEARGQIQAQRVGVLVDARMSEVYAGAYAWQSELNEWTPVLSLKVGPPEDMLMALKSLPIACDAWAGNGFEVYKDRLNLTLDKAGDSPADQTAAQPVVSPENFPVICASAMPHALALLRLAPAQWASGKAVAPEQVQPLYIRNKVAQTTAEREAMKASQLS